MSLTLTSNVKWRPYRRYRTLARSLHGRIWVSREGRLCLVSGRPDFEKLLACLASYRDVPASERSPGPCDLGFPICCDGELTDQNLNVISRALTRWIRALDREPAIRPPGKRRSQQISWERREAELLRQRLAACYQWHRRLSSAQSPKPDPYPLENHEETELARALAPFTDRRALPPLTCWLARVVLWMSGDGALARFLNALPDARPVERPLFAVRELRQRLRDWELRSRHECWRALHREMRLYVQSLPQTLVSDGHLGCRLRGRTFAQHCDLLIRRCQQLLTDGKEPFHRAAAALAAVACCDGSKAPLPKRLAAECCRSGDCRALDQMVTNLYEEAGKAGYDQLLIAFDQLDQLPHPCYLENIRIILAGGASLEDAAWAIREDLLHCFDGNGAAPAWARRLQDELAVLKLPASEFGTLLAAVKTRNDAAVVDRLVQWLKTVPPRTVTPRIARLLKSAIVNLVVPGMTQLSCHCRLNSWARPPKPVLHTVGRKTTPEVETWLDRIGHYRRLAGSEAAVPKSVRNLLDRIDADRLEAEYLRGLADRHCANDAQLARLNHLRSRAAAPVRAGEARILRTAQEAFVVAAIEALRAVVRQSAAEIWLDRAGCPFPDEPLSRLVKFAGWAQRLDEPKQQLLRLILDAWRRHGAGYKSRLAANSRWLARARKRGVDLAEWLQAEPAVADIDGQRFRIGPAHDPIEVFRMGCYFGTCLGLGEFNEMSVLANAHDANKQVVFLYGADGKVWGRQLVAISTGFQLLGYHCYTSVDHRNAGSRDMYIAAMAGYCGRWARRCGIALGTQGEPEEIGEHFWYDDGVWEWHQAARDAWQAEGEPNLREWKCPEAESEDCILCGQP
ncbi:MAG: hypothetical protein WD278_05585 [Pirellulales bacterium]